MFWWVPIRLPQPRSDTTTSLFPNTAAQNVGGLLALHPCKTTRHIRNALDFLDVHRSLAQRVLSRSGTSPVPPIIYSHTPKNCSVHALWSPLQPPQVLGRLFLWPPWWKSQPNRQCLRFHSQFLGGSTSGETQMGGRPTDPGCQWVNFSVAWGSLHYGKCLPGDEKMISHYLF